MKDAAGTFRTYGHELIERMADHLETLAARPVSTTRPPQEMAGRFAEPVPHEGDPADEVWADVWERVVGESISLHHPMYMGHQVAPPLPHAVLADALASLLNQSIAVWEMSPTGTLVEAQVVRWMIELLGYPSTADGTVVSGGSVANLTGLLAAREALLPGSWRGGVRERAVVFAPAHAHYSAERAVGLMGLGSDAVIPVAGKRGKMDIARLEAAIREARADGLFPLAVVATAAGTATGLFDDLLAIGEITARERIWLHVDGAHGASFLASARLRPLLAGIERADSVAWDPHKMMFMPISMGTILVRRREHLDAAFQQSAPYLFHPRPGEERSRDIGKRTLQCSKRFDALKLWVSLKHYGLGYFAELQERTVDNTVLLHAMLTEAEDFEPMHTPESNILCFRYLPEAVRGRAGAVVDELQRELRERYNASGRGWITATVLDDRRVLRVTLMNPATEPAHLEALLAGLRLEGEAILKGTTS